MAARKSNRSKSMTGTGNRKKSRAKKSSMGATVKTPKPFDPGMVANITMGALGSIGPKKKKAKSKRAAKPKKGY